MSFEQISQNVLIDFQNEYPGVVTESNANDICHHLKNQNYLYVNS